MRSGVSLYTSIARPRYIDHVKSNSTVHDPFKPKSRPISPGPVALKPPSRKCQPPAPLLGGVIQPSLSYGPSYSIVKFFDKNVTLCTPVRGTLSLSPNHVVNSTWSPSNAPSEPNRSSPLAKRTWQVGESFNTLGWAKRTESTCSGRKSTAAVASGCFHFRPCSASSCRSGPCRTEPSVKRKTSLAWVSNAAACHVEKTARIAPIKKALGQSPLINGKVAVIKRQRKEGERRAIGRPKLAFPTALRRLRGP